jgi:hypothetical protein
MRPRGGIIGASTAPTTTSAGGIWSLREAEFYTRSVTWPALPSPPTNVSGGGGNQTVGLTWVAPAQNGGSAITDYAIQYSSNSGSTWTTFNHSASTSTAIQVTGLTNGTAYVFRVATVTAVGTGGYSATSASVTPAGSIISLAYTAGSWNGSGTSVAPFTSSSVFGPTNNALLPFSFTAISDADVTFSVYQYNSTNDDNHQKQNLYYRVNGANIAYVNPSPGGSAATDSLTLRLFANEVLTFYVTGYNPYNDPTDLYTSVSMSAVAAAATKLKILSTPFAITGTGTAADPFVTPTTLTTSNFTANVQFIALAAGTLYASGTVGTNNDDNSNNLVFVWDTKYGQPIVIQEGTTQTKSATILRSEIVHIDKAFPGIPITNLKFWMV